MIIFIVTIFSLFLKTKAFTWNKFLLNNMIHEIYILVYHHMSPHDSLKCHCAYLSFNSCWLVVHLIWAANYCLYSVACVTNILRFMFVTCYNKTGSIYVTNNVKLHKGASQIYTPFHECTLYKVLFPNASTRYRPQQLLKHISSMIGLGNSMIVQDLYWCNELNLLHNSINTAVADLSTLLLMILVLSWYVVLTVMICYCTILIAVNLTMA